MTAKHWPIVWLALAACATAVDAPQSSPQPDAALPDAAVQQPADVWVEPDSPEPTDSAPPVDLPADVPDETELEPADVEPADVEPADGGPADGESDSGLVKPPLCPEGSVFLTPPDGADAFCIDRFEAPNTPGGLPLVMFTFDQSVSWCQARGKRLCFDDEWTFACAGTEGSDWPYGELHQPGLCNDDQLWKVYSQSKLNGWPGAVSDDGVETVESLLAAAKASGAAAHVAAEHVESLYQATFGGEKPACGGEFGVFDLTGNVEEWTRRRDGGQPSFHGNLKGRYWAEARTCHQSVKSHGDAFRFYEIGFRCCSEPVF